MISSLPAESKDIADLLLEHARPLVGEMTEENQLVLYGRRPLLVAYFDVDWDRQLRKGMEGTPNMARHISKDVGLSPVPH